MFALLFIIWKLAVTIYLVVCLRVGPTRVRTKKVQKGSTDFFGRGTLLER